MASSITFASILARLPASDNPFESLDTALQHELHREAPEPLRKLAYILLGLMGITLVADLLALGIKGFRGDRWLYKVKERPQGTLIIPNTIVHFLLWNAFYIVIAFPFIIFAVRPPTDLKDNPLWMCFAFLFLFFAVWHVAWGTSIGAILQAARTTLHLAVPAVLLNSFFMLALVSAPPSMFATTYVKTMRWNRGIAAFTALDTALKQQAEYFTGPGDAAMVIMAIPNGEILLQQMVAGLYRFVPPYYVCAVYALVSALVMLLACIVQSRILSKQLRQLSSVQTASTSESSGNKALLSGRRASGETASLFRKVIVVSVTLCAAMFAYFCVCLVANLVVPGQATPIFQISSSRKIHGFLMVFAFSIVDAAATGAIVWQIFSTPYPSRPRRPFSNFTPHPSALSSQATSKHHWIELSPPQSPASSKSFGFTSKRSNFDLEGGVSPQTPESAQIEERSSALPPYSAGQVVGCVFTRDVAVDVEE